MKVGGKNKKKSVVALVGRPNVGKSTLFNRLVGRKEAIIEDTPGVTRDRIYGTVNYDNYSYHLIDTGGIEITEQGINDEITGQAELAIDEADIVLFVVDGKEGLTSSDEIVRQLLMKSGKPVIVVINKTDSKNFKDHEYDFYSLGFDETQLNMLTESEDMVNQRVAEIKKIAKTVQELS